MTVMKIAFYAPMKPVDHAVPSGDREIARSLVEALGLAGYSVEVASRFSSRDGTGDRDRQARLKNVGERLARRLIRHYRTRPVSDRPACVAELPRLSQIAGLARSRGRPGSRHSVPDRRGVDGAKTGRRPVGDRIRGRQRSDRLRRCGAQPEQ